MASGSDSSRRVAGCGWTGPFRPLGHLAATISCLVRLAQSLPNSTATRSCTRSRPLEWTVIPLQSRSHTAFHPRRRPSLSDRRRSLPTGRWTGRRHVAHDGLHPPPLREGRCRGGGGEKKERTRADAVRTRGSISGQENRAIGCNRSAGRDDAAVSTRTSVAHRLLALQVGSSS